MVTSAHRVEVEVGADGPTSAPLSGAATAAPPAGATSQSTTAGPCGASLASRWGGRAEPTTSASSHMFSRTTFAALRHLHLRPLLQADALPNVCYETPGGGLLQRCLAPPLARRSHARLARPPAKPQERRMDAYTSKRPLGLKCRPHPRYVPRPRPTSSAIRHSKRPPYSAKLPPTHASYPHANSRLSLAKPNSST
jgi:hypothetical protein